MKKRKKVSTSMVRIGARFIPVVSGASRATFSAGRGGKDEKGAYNFWSASYISGKKVGQIFGRAKTHLDAGERFRRMKKEMKLKTNSAADRKIYGKMYGLLKNAVYVRPATWEEVCKWLLSHKEDAEFLKSVTFK